MYSSRRETLLVTSLTDSLLLPTLTRTDARSAGQQTSAVPVTWTSLTRLPGVCRLTVRTSSPCSFSLPVNSRPEAGSIVANTRLVFSMIQHRIKPTSRCYGNSAKCSSGFVGHFRKGITEGCKSNMYKKKCKGTFNKHFRCNAKTNFWVP